jgi:hypothetical protein
MKCRICDNTKLKLILNLGHHPPSDAFLTEEQLSQHEIHYPLHLYHCEKCGLAQLGYVVAKEVLFDKEYPYQTGQNAGGREHFKGLADSVVAKYGLQHGDLVVDIGGNDGTLLRYFQKHGCDVINVEPSGVSTVSGENGIPTKQEFWGYEVALSIKHIHGTAKVITATNVFAHVDDLNAFMHGIDLLLAEDGVFIVEAPSFTELMRRNAFDTIYHEHLSYLDIEPIKYLVGKYNMCLVHTQPLEVHGGTNRYFIRRISRQSSAEQKKAA